MQTIPQSPHSVNDRRAHQCARPGWRPPQGTPHQLAKDIAESIRQHRANGDTRWTEPHEFTTDAETQALVRQLLATDSPSACIAERERGASAIPTYRPAYLLGKLANGAERDKGRLWHALPTAGGIKALCGAQPGRRSAGWGPHHEGHADGQRITCRKCLKRIESQGHKADQR